MLTTLKKALGVILLLLSIISCTTDDINLSLPEKTQEGKNTLGFETDGKVWVNYGEICNWGKCDPNVVEGRLHTNLNGTQEVVILAYHNDKRRNISQSIQINIKNVTGPGTYILNKEKGESMELITDWTQNEFFSNNQNSNAKLIITRLDPVNHIISGEFSGLLFNYHNPSLTRDISNGRFDAKLTYTME